MQLVEFEYTVSLYQMSEEEERSALAGWAADSAAERDAEDSGLEASGATAPAPAGGGRGCCRSARERAVSRRQRVRVHIGSVLTDDRLRVSAQWTGDPHQHITHQRTTLFGSAQCLSRHVIDTNCTAMLSLKTSNECKLRTARVA